MHVHHQKEVPQIGLNKAPELPSREASSLSQASAGPKAEVCTISIVITNYILSSFLYICMHTLHQNIKSQKEVPQIGLNKVLELPSREASSLSQASAGPKAEVC